MSFTLNKLFRKSLLSAIFASSFLFACAQTLVKPDQHLSEIAHSISTLMTKYHYEDQKIDQAKAEQVFDNYIKSIDPQKIYFLESDIQEFSKLKPNLQKNLKEGNLSIGFIIYNRLQERIENQNKSALLFIESPFDFTLKETINLDREKAEFAKNQAQLDQIWIKRVKFDILNLMLNDKTFDEAKQTLKKRYEIRIKRLRQVESRDIAQLYINALMTSFDSHSSYFSPKASDNFNISMSLKLNGIGTVLKQDEDTVKIVDVVAGGPADLSGQIQVADEIVGVAQGDTGEWLDIYGMRLDDVVDKIRGERGSIVRLQLISAKNKGAVKEVKIIRDTIDLNKQAAQSSIKNITSHGRTNKIGVITLPTFYSDIEGKRAGASSARSTTKDVQALVEDMKKENIDGLVIDLRGNGGGSLEEVISLSGLFLKGGTIVQTKSRDGRIAEEHTNKGMIYAGPMIVMVDRLSASASEIFAGAMQDYGRALIVGTTTYGKGTVQTVVPLDRFIKSSISEGAGQAKLTIAKFYRANGSSTQHKGVEPDLAFPSPIDPKIIGESAQDFALAWDEIRKAKDYKKDTSLGNLLPKLVAAHQLRLKTEKELLIYQQQVAISLDAWKEKEYSLNLKERKLDQKNKEELNMKLLNELRVLASLPVLTLEQIKKNDDYITDEEERKNKIDPVLNEGINILIDEIHLILASTPNKAT
ncbi:carboxy-terminal protease for penicillin-binding protein 3 [Gammaproteobacteria bacterium]|nr:carboxy-terminal protease for penicillin-binding protein 3 [Gammaproteobacteria bacterium]